MLCNCRWERRKLWLKLLQWESLTTCAEPSRQIRGKGDSATHNDSLNPTQKKLWKCTLGLIATNRPARCMLFESLESMYSRLQKLLTESFSVLLLIPINQLVRLFGSVERPNKPDLLIFEVLWSSPLAGTSKGYKKLRKVTNELRKVSKKLQKVTKKLRNSYKKLQKVMKITNDLRNNFL